MNTKKRIIIGGLPRSGKNMVKNLIGSNSQVTIPPSAFNFFYFFSNKKFKERGSYKDNLDFFINSCWKSKNWNLKESDLTKEGETPKDLYINLLESYRQTHYPYKPIVGEYTHVIEEYFNVLIEWFGLNNIKFIHIIRNPFDTYASYIKSRKISKQERGNTTSKSFVNRFCNMWSQSSTLGFQRAVRFPENYRVILFEDFKENPETRLKDCCSWLEIPFEPENMFNMVDYPKKQNSEFVDNPENLPGIGFIRKDNVDRTGNLTKYEKEALSNLSCPYLTTMLGYENKAVRINWKFGKSLNPDHINKSLSMFRSSSLANTPSAKIITTYFKQISNISVELIKLIILVIMRKLRK